MFEDLTSDQRAALRGIVDEWIREGFTIPPYTAAQYDIFEAFRLDCASPSTYDTRRPGPVGDAVQVTGLPADPVEGAKRAIDAATGPGGLTDDELDFYARTALEGSGLLASGGSGEEKCPTCGGTGPDSIAQDFDSGMLDAACGDEWHDRFIGGSGEAPAGQPFTLPGTTDPAVCAVCGAQFVATEDSETGWRCPNEANHGEAPAGLTEAAIKADETCRELAWWTLPIAPPDELTAPARQALRELRAALASPGEVVATESGEG